MHDVEFGPATLEDLPSIIRLLSADPLGRTREIRDPEPYRRAFLEIDADSNHMLVVGRSGERVVSTLQVSVLPCLTHGGTTRAQIEAVHVDEQLRSHGIGTAMCTWAIAYARARGCGIVQLTSDLRRDDALRFYERLGFRATHHGLKLMLDPADS